MDFDCFFDELRKMETRLGDRIDGRHHGLESRTEDHFFTTEYATDGGPLFDEEPDQEGPLFDEEDKVPLFAMEHSNLTTACLSVIFDQEPRDLTSACFGFDDEPVFDEGPVYDEELLHDPADAAAACSVSAIVSHDIYTNMPTECSTKCSSPLFVALEPMSSLKSASIASPTYTTAVDTARQHSAAKGHKQGKRVAKVFLNGLLVEACRVFDQMPHKDVIAWTAMIDGALSAAGGLKNGLPSSSIHCCLMKEGFVLDIVVWNVLSDRYAQSRDVENALLVVKIDPGGLNVVFGTSLIDGYIEGIECCMGLKPVGLVSEASRKFGIVVERTFEVWTGYKDGGMPGEMPEQNAVSHNVLLSGAAADEGIRSVCVANSFASMILPCGVRANTWKRSVECTGNINAHQNSNTLAIMHTFKCLDHSPHKDAELKTHTHPMNFLNSMVLHFLGFAHKFINSDVALVLLMVLKLKDWENGLLEMDADGSFLHGHWNSDLKIFSSKDNGAYNLLQLFLIQVELKILCQSGVGGFQLGQSDVQEIFEEKGLIGVLSDRDYELISFGAAESMELLWRWKPPWPYKLREGRELVEDSAHQKCGGVDELYVQWSSLVWFYPDCVLDKLGPSLSRIGHGARGAQRLALICVGVLRYENMVGSYLRRQWDPSIQSSCVISPLYVCSRTSHTLRRGECQDTWVVGRNYRAGPAHEGSVCQYKARRQLMEEGIEEE